MGSGRRAKYFFAKRSQFASEGSLEALAPERKTIIHTLGDHIGTGRDRQVTLEKAMEETRRWLIAEGAVNPVGWEVRARTADDSLGPPFGSAASSGMQCRAVPSERTES